MARKVAGKVAGKVTEKIAGKIPAPVSDARLRLHHSMLGLFFVLWVLVPTGVATWYLFGVARDQYASTVGFTVRKEEMGSALELLGGITSLSGTATSDTDVLYEFIQSQGLVRRADQALDLARIYQRPGDPVFSLGDDTRIEALTRYWRRMVKIYYDTASGLIKVRVLAFDPDDAQQLARLILTESGRMINDLSAVSRADATRYTREELDQAVARLKAARQAMVTFQIHNQIVDPSADIEARMGLLNSLLAQLAEVRIAREQLSLQGNSNPDDPRAKQLLNKQKAIQNLIAEERAKIVGADSGNQAYADLLSQFEALKVDLEFAQQAYVSAQAAHDVARAEAQRKSRYLATYIEPSRAQSAEYPRRFVLLTILAGFLLISWALIVMIYYSIRDRR